MKTQKSATVNGAPMGACKGGAVVWAKPCKTGMAAIRLHAAGTGKALTACGKLQSDSTYIQPNYKPLHALYATTAAGAAAVATGRVVYANGNTAANVVCGTCCKQVPAFGALVAGARKPKAQPVEQEQLEDAVA